MAVHGDAQRTCQQSARDARHGHARRRAPRAGAARLAGRRAAGARPRSRHRAAARGAARCAAARDARGNELRGGGARPRHSDRHGDVAPVARPREAAHDDARPGRRGQAEGREVSAEPTVTEADLQAYADGRLAVERRAEVESWLAGRPEDAERVTQHLESTATRRPRARRIAAVAGWITLGALLGALAGWEARDWRRPAGQPLAEGAVMARRAAIAHATYSPEVRHPVEV